MAVYLAIAFFALTAIVVTIALADSAVRFRNVRKIARRNLAATQEDLSLELQSIDGNVVTLRRHARECPPQATSLFGARRLPTSAGAVSAAA